MALHRAAFLFVRLAERVYEYDWDRFKEVAMKTIFSFLLLIAFTAPVSAQPVTYRKDIRQK